MFTDERLNRVDELLMCPYLVHGIGQLDRYAIFIASPGFNGDSNVLDGDHNADGDPNIRPPYS